MFDAATGELLRTFLNPSPAAGEQFGYSVAAVGDKVLIGADMADDETGIAKAGAAYLFDADTGELLQTFHNPTPQTGDHFGYFAAAVEGNVLVGAYADDTVGPDAGAAYLFDSETGDLLQA